MTGGVVPPGPLLPPPAVGLGPAVVPVTGLWTGLGSPGRGSGGRTPGAITVGRDRTRVHAKRRRLDACEAIHPLPAVPGDGWRGERQ